MKYTVRPMLVINKTLYIENQLKSFAWVLGQNFTGNEFILSNRAPKVANAILVEGELEPGTHVSFDDFLPLGKLKNQIRSFKCVCRWVLNGIGRIAIETN